MNTDQSLSDLATNYRQFKMFELCPVCQKHNVIKGGRYCSPACYTEAYNFRKRLMIPCQFLRRIGFCCTFNRTLLTVEMPDKWQSLYPKLAHKFYFPPPVIDLHELSAKSLWFELGQMLGEPLSNYIQFLCERDFFAADEIDALLRIFVHALYNSNPFTFECHVCETRFMHSANAGSGSPVICVDCLNDLYDQTVMES